MKKILLMLLAITLIAGCSKEDGTTKNDSGGKSSESGKKNEVDYSSKLKTEGFVVDSGSMVVMINNKNTEPVYIEVEVEFYDKDENIIAVEEGYVSSAVPDSEFAIEVYGIPEKFDSYKIYADADKAYTNDYSDDVKITSNDNGEEIIVQAKNNSEEELEEIVVCVVYFKDDKIVGVSEESDYAIKAGRTANFEAYYPYDADYDDIDFDEYKVYLVSAYTFEDF